MKPISFSTTALFALSAFVTFFSATANAVTLQERIEGSILGVYLGDSLGKGCEVVYKDHPELAPQSYQDRNITELEPREDKPEGGFYKGRDKHQVRGTYTDDTEETLAVLRSILTEKKYDSEKSTREVAKAYRPAHGYSKSSGALFTAIDQSPTSSSVIEIRNQFNLSNDATRAYRDSNGCAMRISSLAILHSADSLRDLRRIIYESCDPTHPGLAPKEGAALIAIGIQWALSQPSWDGKKFIDQIIASVADYRKQTRAEKAASLEPTLLAAIATATKKSQEQLVEENLNEVEKLLANVEQIPALLAKNMSIQEETEYLRKNFKVTYETVGSVPTTLYLLARYGNDFRTTMNATAQVSLAGDTDTIPAMAGSILGAVQGIKALPVDWVKQLYREDDSWKKEASYKDGYHEDYTPVKNGAVYYPLSQAKEWADQLYQLKIEAK